MTDTVSTMAGLAMVLCCGFIIGIGLTAKVFK